MSYHKLWLFKVNQNKSPTHYNWAQLLMHSVFLNHEDILCQCHKDTSVGREAERCSFSLELEPAAPEREQFLPGEGQWWQCRCPPVGRGQAAVGSESAHHPPPQPGTSADVSVLLEGPCLHKPGTKQKRHSRFKSNATG